MHLYRRLRFHLEAAWDSDGALLATTHAAARRCRLLSDAWQLGPSYFFETTSEIAENALNSRTIPFPTAPL